MPDTITAQFRITERNIRISQDKVLGSASIFRRGNEPISIADRDALISGKLRDFAEREGQADTCYIAFNVKSFRSLEGSAIGTKITFQIGITPSGS